MVSVAIKASMRHGDLHQACKKAGSLVALAKHLEISAAVLGSWYRYESVPPLEERLPNWPKSKIDDIERKLFELTGKLLDDLFPEAIRDREFLRIEKTIETTKEIESSRLIEMAMQVRCLNYKAPDVIEYKELKEAVNYSLNLLSNREREVVMLRYGINCDPMTYEEVGNQLRVTKERIRQIEMKAIRKLQSPKIASRLVGHID